MSSQEPAVCWSIRLKHKIPSSYRITRWRNFIQTNYTHALGDSAGLPCMLLSTSPPCRSCTGSLHRLQLALIKPRREYYENFLMRANASFSVGEKCYSLCDLLSSAAWKKDKSYSHCPETEPAKILLTVQAVVSSHFKNWISRKTDLAFMRDVFLLKLNLFSEAP